MKTIKAANTDYLLETALEKLHQESQDWLSAIDLWKKEMALFKKLIEKNTAGDHESDLKARSDHFLNIIFYYNNELLDGLSKKIEQHERLLASQMGRAQQLDEVDYRTLHIKLKGEVNAIDKQFHEYRQEIFQFLEPLMKVS